MIRTGKFKLVPVIILSLFWAFLAMPGAAFCTDPHDFTDFGCEECHRDIDREKAMGKVDLKEGIDAQCVICHGACGHGKKHSGSNGASENMGVSLPLDRGGKISCFTCHDPHMDLIDTKSRLKTTYLRINNLKRELCLNCHRVGGKSSGSLRVIYPPSQGLFNGEYLPLVGSVDDAADTHLMVNLNGTTFPLRIRNSHFYTRLLIKEGMNSLELSLGNEVLWRGALFGMDANQQTVNYDRVYYGHQIGSRNECRGCHADHDGDDLAAVTSYSGLCQRCHRTDATKKFLHGPRAVGECDSCHEPHGGVGRYYLKVEGSALCLTCHDSMAGEGRDCRSMVASGRTCLECHDPHQSDSWFLSRSSRVVGQ